MGREQPVRRIRWLLDRAAAAAESRRPDVRRRPRRARLPHADPGPPLRAERRRSAGLRPRWSCSSSRCRPRSGGSGASPCATRTRRGQRPPGRRLLRPRDAHVRLPPRPGRAVPRRRRPRGHHADRHGHSTSSTWDVRRRGPWSRARTSERAREPAVFPQIAASGAAHCEDWNMEYGDGNPSMYRSNGPSRRLTSRINRKIFPKNRKFVGIRPFMSCPI